MSRSVSGLALPPTHYGRPKGSFFQGTHELERFPPTYPDQSQLFDEYMSNKSMAQNRHVQALSSSSGLLELHYDTMRKHQKDRATRPAYIHGPTMDRPYQATSGYGAFIPGKESGNIVGCTFSQGSRIAHEQRGRHFDPPLSGNIFHLGPGKGGSRSTGSLFSAGASMSQTR
eukprot:TRINITY_DN73157_c0_g1_i1.p1 TRINITY_DN73157_c0_g1~~TRINITY_DN73157_c0_g1_i1.p1  ORF type:complete len:172 (+),score=29.46 TRINITY_DN73157_c0_g1_i1:199-714(+)